MDLKTWSLASRTRFALVWTAINALTVVGVKVLVGSPFSERYLAWAIPVLLLAFVLNGWVWYPRAKGRATARPG